MTTSRPEPTPLFHFTRVEHLPTIIEDGLLCDAVARATGRLAIEVGNTSIKDQRRRRTVPVEPGGTVADYVPFYYATRSPMMYAIHHGNVGTYSDGCARLVYLVTTLERLSELALPHLITDRNAVLGYARFAGPAVDTEPGFVDWDLMQAVHWGNTPEEPDRRERRMAECLVHQRVPWEAFVQVSTYDEEVAAEARQMIRRSGQLQPVAVRRQWYF